MNTKYIEFIKKVIYSDPMNKDVALHAAVGLAGEAGEVLELFKKEQFMGRDLTPEMLADELSDVVFYLSLLLHEANMSLEDVIEFNVNKLSERYAERLKGK